MRRPVLILLGVAVVALVAAAVRLSTSIYSAHSTVASVVLVAPGSLTLVLPSIPPGGTGSIDVDLRRQLPASVHVRLAAAGDAAHALTAKALDGGRQLAAASLSGPLEFAVQVPRTLHLVFTRPANGPAGKPRVLVLVS